MVVAGELNGEVEEVGGGGGVTGEGGGVLGTAIMHLGDESSGAAAGEVGGE